MLDLELLIKNYQPSAETKRRVADSPLVLMTGISGSGKDVIIDGLVKTGQYYECVSYTTRPPRVNDGVSEVDGQDYHFISAEQAREMLEQQEFIEAKLVHGIIYGSAMAEIDQAQKLGKMPINAVDVQGVDEYFKLTKQVRAILVLPPSYEVWLARLKQRYPTEAAFYEVWPARRDSAIKELEFALTFSQLEWLINDNLDAAVATAQQLINGSAQQSPTMAHKQIARTILEKLLQSID